ncbi:hypothetical protein HPP92_025102 [Vanilla planifolia]|uniref:Macro domain-containing protein n=1 Tax=Vanilla planifolia TaxID=51239 RepID=A0A835U8M8_VANPL|nr:hypothetical protein HPP92_025102 [Vanilla planifolia]
MAIPLSSADTIANGKAGTKAQCLKSAAEALKEGKNVLIDRCNLELEQRSEFVKLCGAQADAHAVVLDLPARLCISRSVKRTGHEGNLQGGKAAAVVNRMLQKKEPPKQSEGFSRIVFCQNETDVRNAVDSYSSLGLFDSLASGIFGQKNLDNKVQQGIMKFLKKLDTVGNVSQDTFKSECKDLSPESVKEKEDRKDKQINPLLQKPIFSDFHCNGAPTLAFPSISTSDFQFNQDKASDVIVDAVANFLSKDDKVRLILVDLSPKSNMLSLVRFKASKKNVDTKRFSTYAGDITRINTEGQLKCNVIANATNWRLKPGGGGVNAAIFGAGGKALEIATKKQAETISPGTSVVVTIPTTSPLYQREGFTHVIHVLGPNMNPQRPNCLQNDYVKGFKILHDAYNSLFENFASVIRSKNSEKEDDRVSEGEHCESVKISAVGSAENQASHVEQKIKREGSHASDRKKKCIPHVHDEEEVQKSSKTAHSTKRSWPSWSHALHELAMNPEKHKESYLEISDDYVIVNDRYPKAKRHILVIARLPGLDCLADLRCNHLPLLKKMHVVGLKWAEKFTNDDPSLVFRLGYHSAPSMRQLHLHVISQDFESSHLKNRKHWNSFNTLFFCDSVDIIKEIEANGLASMDDYEKLLSLELRCHHCKSAHPNIPRLKSHIASCKAPFPIQLQNGRLVFSSTRSSAAACDT